jgi:hypothetical protein
MSADGWLWVADLQRGDGHALLATTTPERATVIVTDPDHRPGRWTLAIQQVEDAHRKYRVWWQSASALPTPVYEFYRGATLALIETITDAGVVRAVKRGPVTEIWPGASQRSLQALRTDGGEH